MSLDDALQKLRRFWNWWSGELADLVPLHLRAATKFLSDTTFVELEDMRVRAKRYREGRMQDLEQLELAPLPPAERPLALRAWLMRIAPALDRLACIISSDSGLMREIEMPRAAEENLRQTVEFELNRYTPFKASDVYFDYRVIRRALGGRGMTLQIAVVPKARIYPSLAALAKAGLRPAAVVLGDDLDGKRVPLNLLPPERRRKPAPRVSVANTVLAGLALIAFGVALALPVLQKRHDIAALNPLVESAREEAEGADQLKTELDTQVKNYDFLLLRKHAYPAAAIVIDELTRILPDGTWLQQMNLRSHPKGWEIQIQGETTISAKLASIIEDSPLFRDATFKSPLVKGQGQGSERFHLAAELEPAPAPAAQDLADKRSPPVATAARAVERAAADNAPQPVAPLPAAASAPQPVAPPPAASPRP